MTPLRLVVLPTECNVPQSATSNDERQPVCTQSTARRGMCIFALVDVHIHYTGGIRQLVVKAMAPRQGSIRWLAFCKTHHALK